MLRKPIPSTGEMVPAVGLGTWKAFDVADAEPRRPLIDELATAGGAIIDSSPMYRRSEAVIGELIRGRRDRFFVATKVWTSGRENGLREMEDSMRKMGARPVDLLQVHNLLDVDTHLATLAAWKAAGTVRYVGVTHYTATSHPDVEKVLRRHPVDFLQINYSVAEREAESRLLPLALEKGIAVIANRPLATGDLPQRLRSRPVPEWAGAIGAGSWTELLLKFVISHPSITCAIPATSSLQHLKQNLRAGEGEVLPEALRLKIVKAALS
jgi:aryl-alcohol dehydrogenase-like predicted oxidoreductase